jgi:hypothetical protein
MAEITAAAYQDLRDHVEATWTYIALLDDTSTEVVRLPLSDARVTWTHIAGAQTLELTVVLSGSDAEISGSLPKTISESRLYKVAVAGDSFSTETFSDFIIQTTDDQITVKHRLEVPEIP